MTEQTDDDPYAVLQRQYEESERQRRAAEARAVEAETARQAALKDQRQAHEAVFQHASTAADAQILAAQQAYAAAAACNDHAGMAKAQTLLTQATVAAQRYQEGRDELKRQPAPANPATPQTTPRTEAWLKAHPDVLSDPRKMQRAIAYDALARAEGLEVESDAYFAFIEEKMGYAKTDAPPASQSSKGSPSPSAPVQRRPSVGGAGTKTTADNLTAEQREYADALGMTYDKYAENLEKAKKSGRLGRFANGRG